MRVPFHRYVSFAGLFCNVLWKLPTVLGTQLRGNGYQAPQQHRSTAIISFRSDLTRHTSKLDEGAVFVIF